MLVSFGFKQNLIGMPEPIICIRTEKKNEKKQDTKMSVGPLIW
jgi:hypothetical protein